MKTLDVKSLLSGIDGSIHTINEHQEHINAVATDIKDFLSLGNAFSGKGADAIKSFYEECHVPFLIYYDQFLVKFRRALYGIKDAYPTVESEESGFISEAFLETDLKIGLQSIKNNTVALTDEVNDLVNQVSDICSLPKINDDDVLKGIENSERKMTNIKEELQDFDTNQTKELKEIDEELTLLINYIKEIETMFKGGKTTVDSSDLNKFKKTESFTKLKNEMKKFDWTNIPLASASSVLLDLSAPISSYGNTFGTVSEGTALAETAYKVTKHGVKITSYDEGYIVQNGRHIGIKGKNYPNSYLDSQLKIGNSPEIAIRVRPSSAVKSAFKSKLGIAGIALTAGENAYNNIQSNASSTKVVGDVAVDVGLGAVSLAGGAAVVAVFAGAGIPLLGVAAVGFLASTAVAYITEGFKFGNNEKTISDSLKDGVQKGIKTVAGWFK